MVASTISFAPAANAAPVAASAATFGASCATVGATAAGKGADGSALTCAKETHGSFKGKTIWTYKTWPVLSAAEIVIPTSLTSGFGGFGKAVADALKAEALLKADVLVAIGHAGQGYQTVLTRFAVADKDEREVLRKHLLELFSISQPDAPELAQARRALAALLY